MNLMAASSPAQEVFYCEKCKKTMVASKFYTYRDGTKLEMCKSCLTMHLNVYEPETFLWIMEKLDVPFIEAEWNSIRDKAIAKDPKKINGSSIFGKYLSIMKLKQHKDYRWEDTERLAAEAKRIQEEYGTTEEAFQEKVKQMRQAYVDGEITEAQWNTYKETMRPSGDPGSMTPTPVQDPQSNAAFPTLDQEYATVELPNMEDELSEEEKIYLAMKWGRLYSAADWIYMEKKYEDFSSSFDIQDAGRIDTLIQICKLSLKVNTALDSGDYDTYSKLARNYDALMKSAKFTEAQKKENKTEEFSSYGKIVELCELETGYIPRIDLSVDRDVVDADLRDIKEYTKSLISEDQAISRMIEEYIKKREILQQQEEMEKDGFELTDTDLKEYNDFIKEYEEEEEEE
jgi:hypothetical protein